MTKKNLDAQIKLAKKIHDHLAYIRFLENLHAEILLAEDISAIKDPHILSKLQDCIAFFKDNHLEKN